MKFPFNQYFDRDLFIYLSFMLKNILFIGWRPASWWEIPRGTHYFIYIHKKRYVQQVFQGGSMQNIELIVL